MASLSYDLSRSTRIECDLLHTEYNNVDLPGIIYDLNNSTNNQFNVRYIVQEDRNGPQQLLIQAWHQETFFNGDSSKAYKFDTFYYPFITLPVEYDDGTTPVLAIAQGHLTSTGVRAFRTFGDADSPQWTIGLDWRRVEQRYLERDVDADGNEVYSGNYFGVPESSQDDEGVFTNLLLPVGDRLTFTFGGRVDYTKSCVDLNDSVVTHFDPGTPAEDDVLSAVHRRTGLHPGHGLRHGQVEDDRSRRAQRGHGLRHAGAQPVRTLQRRALCPHRRLRQQLPGRKLDAQAGARLAGGPGHHQRPRPLPLRRPRLLCDDVGLHHADPGLHLRDGGHAHERPGPEFLGLSQPTGARTCSTARPMPTPPWPAIKWATSNWPPSAAATSSAKSKSARASASSAACPISTARTSPASSSSTAGYNGSVKDGSFVRLGGTESLPDIYPFNGRIAVRVCDPDKGKWGVEFIARLVHSQDEVAWSIGQLPSPGFTVYDLKGYYCWSKNLRLTLALDNLLNRDYYEPGSVVMLNQAGVPEFIREPGFTTVLGVDYRR